MGLQSDSAPRIARRYSLLVIHTPSCRATRLTTSRGTRTNTFYNCTLSFFFPLSLVDEINSHGRCLQAASNTLVQVRLRALITTRTRLPPRGQLACGLRAACVRPAYADDVLLRVHSLTFCPREGFVSPSLSAPCPQAPAPHNLSSRHLPSTPRSASQDALNRNSRRVFCHGRHSRGVRSAHTKRRNFI